jgi:hypothetical protein
MLAARARVLLNPRNFPCPRGGCQIDLATAPCMTHHSRTQQGELFRVAPYASLITDRFLAGKQVRGESRALHREQPAATSVLAPAAGQSWSGD